MIEAARRRALLIGALLSTTLVPRALHAGCTTTQDASTVKRSISRAVRCNDKKLKKGPTATCTLTPAPACAGSLVTDAVALAYGANDPPTAAVDGRALRNQLKCQKRIGKAVSSYVGTKLRGLVRGQDLATLETRASKQLGQIPERCLVNVAADGASGLLVPAVGPQCGAAVGNAGSAVDAAPLRDCLHTLLQVWVDRWGPNPQPLRPNILFILDDDQRWDTTDATHSPMGAFIMPRTRAELADHGVEFPQAFMTTPLCCPSRSSILKGQFAHRTGVYKNGGTNGGADDFDDSSCLPVWLQAAGYRTSLIGKYLNGYGALWNHMTQPPYVPPGWNVWQGLRKVSYFNEIFVEPDGMGGYHEVQYGSAETDYVTDVMREKAKAFITESVGLGQPFFLYLAFKAPHLPQIPAPRHDGKFQGITPWRPPSWNEADVSDKPTWVQNTPLMTPAEQADLDQIRIDQLEMVQAVDEAIGGSTTYGITGIMETLRNLGVADNTIVVFFSDNGWQWGEHRMRAKNKPYEESIRSPMLVYYPKLAPLPRKDSHFALNVDLAPTFAELAGAGVPIVESGMSLVRVIDGTQATWRTDLLTEGWPATHPWATVREAQWKYTEIPVTPGDPNTAFEKELYDLVNDPYELTNVASDPAHAARIAQMAARLRQLRQNWPIDSDPNGPDPDEDDE
jgi:N-acetylglucosamine-6-sulfatase